MGDTTTNRAYRKPLSGDPAVNLTSYWRNLADDIDADVNGLTGKYRWTQAGTVNAVFSSSALASVNVTYPTTFVSTPYVTCQVVSASGGAIKSFTLVTASSNTGFTVRVDLAASASITVAVHWQAVQG